MKKKKTEVNKIEIKQGSKEESLTRRKAIKRIAAIFAGAAVGSKVIGRVPRELYAYVDYVLPYVDSVYVDYSSHGYYSIVYYNSSRYHSVYVPPPYSSSRR